MLLSVFAVAVFSARLAGADFFTAPARGRRFASPSAPTATIFSGCSETRTVRCAVRFSTRNARPIGAGRTRFCDGPWLAKQADTNRRSTSPLKPSFCCALAIADRSSLATSPATDFFVNLRVASARFTSLPRMRASTSPAFWADVRT